MFFIIILSILAGMSIIYFSTRKENILLTCPACPTPVCPTPVCPNNNGNERSSSRDIRVLNDPLYPPTSRATDQTTYDATVDAIKKDRFYTYASNDKNDTYQLLGYLTDNSSDRDTSKEKSLKLFGRMKNNNQGDFYVSPSDRNYLKIATD